MNIEEVSKEQYIKISKNDYIFNSVAFNELNKYKVDELKYLLFKDKKYRLAICIGVRNKEVLCPFSAPFGSMVVIRKPASIKYYDDAVDSLSVYAETYNFTSIRFILPPMFYDETGISIFINTLYRKGYSFKNIDLNFQFDLKKVYSENYPEMLPHNGRKNLRLSLNSNIKIKHCDTCEEKKEAYEVIAENRNAKGYPLKMTFQQVSDTVQVVAHDFFIVMKEEISIAAALVYYIKDSVAQVIYWGDRPGYEECKPINYLAYELINYYGEKGLNYLDIGPSTEESIPNYGLCDFKESIGCDISNKMTLVKYFYKE